MTYFIENERELLAIPIVGIIYNALLYMFILSTFFLASFIDPGIYPRGTHICKYTIVNVIAYMYVFVYTMYLYGVDTACCRCTVGVYIV